MSIKLKDQNNNEIFIAGTNSEDFINDKVLRNDKTWSSNKIVEELYPTFQKEGNPIICYPVENYPLNVKATFSPKQAGSGDPSPENVRAISGYDSVTVNVRGKNLFNISKIETDDYITNNGDGSLTVTTEVDSNGVSSRKTLRELCENIVPGLYTLNAESTGSEKWVYTSATDIWYYGTSKTLTDEMLDSTLYLYASGVNTTATISNIQVELGSTPTPYEPYQPGTTANLTLPETIYGGTVDAVTGVGSSDWTSMIFDGTENWQLYDFSAASNRIMTDVSIPVIEGYTEATMSNALMLNRTGQNRDGWITYYLQKPNVTTTRVVIWADGHSLDELKQIMATAASQGTPLQIVYKVANPTSFQATGNQALPAVAGLNTVYTDGDSLIISGKEDIKYTINQITSNIQNINQIQEINNILLGVE